MEKEVPARLATLGHPQRLAIFRLLMRRYPDRVAAGEIAQALDLKPSTLSAYLSALMQAGLVDQTREGTSLRYGIAMTGVQSTIDYLLRDCCRGRPEMCAPDSEPPLVTRATRDRKSRVLFLCTGNSARSIMAESILRAEAGDRFEAYSAGTTPRSTPHPIALDVLRRYGHDIGSLRAKNVSRFQGDDAPALDFVFTVCDRAANEDCPAWPGRPVSVHWGVSDPVKVDGTEAQKILAFQQAYGVLHDRIRAFAALPFGALDRLSLQRAVDGIATDHAGVPA